MVAVWVESENAAQLTPTEQTIWRSFPRFVEEAFLPHYEKDFLQWSVEFLDDAAMATRNHQIMQHAGPTDVITLTLSKRPWIVETYLGVETMRNNARAWHEAPEVELLRLLFHSLLHGMGYDDRTPEQRRRMRRLEDEWIGRFLRWNKARTQEVDAL